MIGRHSYASLMTQVVDADPSRLKSLAVTLVVESAEGFYARARLHYLEHRTEELARLIQSGNDDAKVVALAKLRLSIRKGTPERGQVNALLGLFAGETGVLVAEAHNVAAMALEGLGLDEDAKGHYLKAYALCVEADCPKRAASMYHNAIAAESRVHPEKRLIYEYHHAYRVAYDAEDFGTAGMALNNLAREYQLMHGFSLALKYVQQALEILEKTHYGTYQYVSALCNRCHLYIDTGQMGAAKTDYEQIGCFDLEEAKTARQTLRKLFEAKGETVPESKSGSVETVSWRSRRQKLEEELARPLDHQLTQLEEHLLLKLSESPQDKHDLSAYLYGKAGDALDKENRLKQLLYRLRRKCPGLVLYEGGRYRIAEPHVSAKK